MVETPRLPEEHGTDNADTTHHVKILMSKWEIRQNLKIASLESRDHSYSDTKTQLEE